MPHRRPGLKVFGGLSSDFSGKSRYHEFKLQVLQVAATPLDGFMISSICCFTEAGGGMCQDTNLMLLQLPITSYDVYDVFWAGQWLHSQGKKKSDRRQ